MIAITSYRNSLKAKKEYCFRSTTDQTLTSEQLIGEIIRYNSTITEADARAVLSVLNDRVKHFVSLGYNVELPFAFIHLKACGTSDRLNAGFTPGTGDHRFEPACSFKEDAAREMADTEAWRIAGAGWVILPRIRELASMNASGQEQRRLEFEPGDMLRLKGKNLGFDISDTRQGVFYVDGGGRAFRATRYHNIGTAIIDVYVPESLEPGGYKVKVVTSPRKDSLEEFTFGE
ncbi:MAG: DUF4469 domain-containing protein, partial [Treponema sp.]|nr:DUF4469 domain-containing protein [Treponema sp.]